MSPSDEALKADVMRRMEEIVEKVLAKRKPADEITLNEIEELALAARQAVGEAITAALVEASQERQAIPGPACPGCGEEMGYKGHKARRVVSRTGEVTVQRAYYYCPTCRRGLFPPG